MICSTDVFKSMILQEFLLEDRLRSEYNYAEVASWLGNLVKVPASVAVEQFLASGVLVFVNAGLTQKAIAELVKVKNTTLVIRAVADVLASCKSDEDNYKSCCRSALCHAIQGSYDWAFGALRVAASKNDNWARHHHLYGLIHGAKGDNERALFELEKALAAEPYAEPRKRIEQARQVVQFLFIDLPQPQHVIV
ncbi:hypothetical protein [Iningainema tapete]|uniref:Uncharacterized protein n=1 Tax=Iningainema tapete BLCC-T55 TaxID=2748662 RepID=A0A8J7BXC7_9CYAN|nr:hypothetical protein [Iningainema tapete]MBD2772683.1 hypothetical protein [Iningainema tapete BLCC-T55]